MIVCYVLANLGYYAVLRTDQIVRVPSRSIPPPWGVNPISSGSPHVRPVGRTCGEPDEIKKNAHPKYFTALFRAGRLGAAQDAARVRNRARDRAR